MISYWPIDSHTLVSITKLTNRHTGALLTDSDVTSITGTLYDADDEAVGDAFAFSYDGEAGKWHATFMPTLTADANYTLEVVVLGPGLQLTVRQTLAAAYVGPKQ